MLLSLREGGASLVLVTHNVEEGLAVATQAAVMLGGRIVRYDDARGIDQRVFQSDYRAMVLGAIDRANERVSVPA